MNNKIGAVLTLLLFCSPCVSQDRVQPGRAQPRRAQAGPEQQGPAAAGKAEIVGEEMVLLDDARAMRSRFRAQAWTAESARIRRQFAGDLEAEELEKFENQVQVAIKALPQEKPVQQDLAALSDTFLVEPEMAAAIESAIAEHLGAQQAKRYAADVRLRREIFDDVAAQSIAIFLADSIAVDDKQMAGILPALRRKIDPQWVTSSQAFGPPQLNAETHQLISRQLTPLQRAALDSVVNDDSSTSLPSLIGYGQANTEERQKKLEEEFARDLDAAVAARLESLQRNLSLEDEQLAKLQVLARGIKVEIQQNRFAALKRFRDMLAGAERDPPDPGVLERATLAPGALFVSHPRWRQFLPKILTAQQRDKLSVMRNVAADGRRAQLVGAMTHGMGRQYQLTGKEAQQLKSLCERHVPRLDSAFRFSDEFLQAFSKMPEEEIRGIIGDENMPSWRSEMSQVKKILDIRKREDQS